MTKNKHRVLNAIADLDGGKVLSNMQNEIEKVAGVIATRFDAKAKGSVTLTLDISRNGEDMVQITPKIKATYPANALRTGLYYSGDEGSIHKRPPNQGDIEDVIELNTKKDA